MFNYGRGRQGLIPLWVGEGDLPTPPFISEAAKASLDRGETFYTYQRGVPELRAAIAAYMTRVYGAAPGGGAFSPENFFVTIGGMHAIEIATRLIVGPGDEALIPSPAWPNFVGALEISGARAVPVRLDRTSRWSLDPDKLAERGDARDPAHFSQLPRQPDRLRRDARGDRGDAGDRAPAWAYGSSPTKFTAASPTTAPARPRSTTSWRPTTRSCSSRRLSKNWAMTGFRVGWLEAPPALGEVIENLIQFTTSGVPVFTQRAATAALEEGEEFLAWQIERCRRSRDILCQGLKATGRVRFFEPEAAFYLFCAVDGFRRIRARWRCSLIDEAGVGAAPGGAFGPGGEGHLRLCFARDPEQIAEATRRMARWLKR